MSHRGESGDRVIPTKSNKIGTAIKIILIVLAALLLVLIAVVKMNQIFSWWLTPPF